MTRRARIALQVAAGLLLAVGLALTWLLHGLPPVESLRDYRATQATRVLDKDGHLLARLAPEDRVVVPLSAISPRVVQAFLAVEDQRFYAHRGIDFRRVLGSLWRDLRTLSLREGSSTLTMQLARNVFPDRLTRARSFRRKLAEMIVARRIENVFTKQQILELYLNQIYLGNGYYGIEAASRGYFGRPAKDLSLPQAALLAALPKAPTTYDPRRAPELAVQRRNLVLKLLHDQKALTDRELAAALHTRLRLKPAEEEGGAPWFVAQVRRALHDEFGADADTLGLVVRTTLDLSLQRSAERELVRQIEAVEKGRLGRFPHPVCDGEPADCLEGMFVALDPRSGDVRALVGGRDYDLSQFDRAVQGRRQPGSTFKAFVWATALNQQIPISSVVDPQPAPGDYAPADGHGDEGPLNLREALRVSSNRVAVALAQRVGIDKVAATAHELGINSPVPEWPSSALGAATVSPLELVAAFAPFANGGMRVRPRFVSEIRTATGEPVGHAPIERSQALSPEVAFLMSSLLADVVDRGTGQAARASLAPEVPLLGKTGTTNEAQDVWFVGGTSEVLAGVWLGFDRPLPIAKWATGGRVAAPVVGRALAAWQRGRPVPAGWTPPSDLEQRDIDRTTGGLATSECPSDVVSHEWFLAGTAPQNPCATHGQGGIAGFFQRAADEVSHWFR